MAHQIEQMAYVGTAPWHGLGSRLTEKQPIEVWQREAGMDWQIQESPVHFKSDAVGHLGAIHSFPEQKVLFRSDTKAPLSVVSSRYHTVQPREVLEFYRDLTQVSGYELETAGVLKGGRKFWALARTGQGATQHPLRSQGSEEATRHRRLAMGRLHVPHARAGRAQSAVA